eukprot:6647024-Pyramimonas_sp.AAC.1
MGGPSSALGPPSLAREARQRRCQWRCQWGLAPIQAVCANLREFVLIFSFLLREKHTATDWSRRPNHGLHICLP